MAGATSKKRLPSGTVAFLFTDIEGSTRRWERSKAAMAAAVAHHDEIVAQCVRAHRGHVFKTVGDAFCCVFSSVPAAVAAALDAHRRLAGEDWESVGGLRIRSAIHVGQAEERGGDYFGPTVNRVARLLGIGHGGQILLSKAAAALMTDLPTGASLLDRGIHRLRDLARPEHVYQLASRDLQVVSRTLRSLGQLPNNLPSQLTRLIDREAPVASIASLRRRYRLVTIAGTAGVGKTRVALAAAVEALDEFRDGVWFVDLSPLNDAHLIPATIASALGYRLPAGADELEGLPAVLRDLHVLIVLDNCEHLVDGVARMVSAILGDCPSVSVLATSRQRLGIGGESVFDVLPLTVPPKDEAVVASDAQRFDAMTLFIERANDVAPIKLTDESASAIADVCRQLDGLPFAVELAAAWARMLDVVQIRDRLRERFRLLIGRNRVAASRQRTLRALLDWSYELLTLEERRLFARLAVFVGGFSLDAAAGVCSDAAESEWDTVQALSGLVEKSLVFIDDLDGERRYRFLETTKQYAAELLEKDGERRAIGRRHAAFFEQLVDAAITAQRNDGNDAALVQIDREIDNVRAVLDFELSAGGDVVRGAELAANMERYWSARGLLPEGIARLRAFAEAVGHAHPETSARVWTSTAVVLANAAPPEEMLEAAERALGVAESTGDPLLVLRALRMRAFAALKHGALDVAQDAVTRAQSLAGYGSAVDERALADVRAYLELALGNSSETMRIWEEERASAHERGDVRNAAALTYNLAEIAHASGDSERAVVLARDAIRSFTEQRDRYSLANALTNLAGYLNAANSLEGAAAAAREALLLWRSLDPTSIGAATALEHGALTLARLGEADAAARIVAFTDRAFRGSNLAREHTEQRGYDQLVEELKVRLSASALEEATRSAAELTAIDAIALALQALDRLAAVSRT